MIAFRTALALMLVLLLPDSAVAQEGSRLFPSQELFPVLLAGPRDVGNSATIMGAFRNPSAHGPGVELEVSLGTTLPVYRLAGTKEKGPVVIGIEGAAFARFGLQVLERELVATDWVFAIPVIWHHENGWTRLRYYHSSSHMGDEYNRRFGDPGFNFSRDAVDLLFFRKASEVLGSWVGARYSYNPHPQDDKRWVLRAGSQLEVEPHEGRYRPFLAADIEWDQEAGMRPRVEARIGTWLPKVDGYRKLRISLVVLSGPSPLGQFGFRDTTQIGFSLQGRL